MVLLQWAEALIEQNDFKGAKDLIDQVRTRAHMPGITIGTLNEMREAVRYERRVELCVEGINFLTRCVGEPIRSRNFEGILNMVVRPGGDTMQQPIRGIMMNVCGRGVLLWQRFNAILI